MKISSRRVIQKLAILTSIFATVTYFNFSNSINIKRNLLEKSKNDRLVVYNAVGSSHNLALINHSRSTSFPNKNWDCLIFMYAKEDLIPDDDEHLRNLQDNLGCTVPRTPGMFWGTFLQFITPTLVSNYDYVALVLDDVFIPNQGKQAVNIDAMIDNMEKHDVHVMSPGVVGDTYKFINLAHEQNMDKCIAESFLIETFLQIFTRDAWECFYNMLHYTGAKGWFYDVCYKPACPDFRLAYDFSMVAYHAKEGTTLPKDQIVGTDLGEWTMDKKFLDNGYFDTKLEKEALKILDRIHCNPNHNDRYNLKEIECPS